jgi:hypothetical protein
MTGNIAAIFTQEVLEDLLPLQRSDEFFEALYGNADEGVYDIRLAYRKYDDAQKCLCFELQLIERPGKCLACNLTYGLPEVFSRHPLINIKALVAKIETLLGGATKCTGWKLGRTQTPQANMHSIPLKIWLE